MYWYAMRVNILLGNHLKPLHKARSVLTHKTRIHLTIAIYLLGLSEWCETSLDVDLVLKCGQGLRVVSDRTIIDMHN